MTDTNLTQKLQVVIDAYQDNLQQLVDESTGLSFGEPITYGVALGQIAENSYQLGNIAGDTSSITAIVGGLDASLQAIASALYSTIGDTPVTAADLLYSINQKLDGVVNGLEAVAQAMGQVENQLITANSTIAALWQATGVGGAGRNNIIGLLSAQVNRMEGCGCNSASFLPDDCPDAWVSIGQNSAQLVEGGPYYQLAVFANPPTGISITSSYVSGDREVQFEDPGSWYMYVSTDAAAWLAFPGGNYEYRTNDWITVPANIEQSFVVAVPLGSSLQVTFCNGNPVRNAACLYMTGSFVDGQGRAVAQWAPGPGVVDGAQGLLDPAFFNGWYGYISGTDQASVVQTNGFFYDEPNAEAFPIPGFLSTNFVLLVNNGGDILAARLCPTEGDINQ